ncbi:hypothetical protein PtA15_6A6 [Puccinia triticina]|uniref:Uncharacterized protein n=1 Tax=Puccinia triticina TaxID=208348 RepID=A0ABY7CM18_9BASI|nr:uncharacterized protein PtA15_6A6 [Puccinia triticina]WAQ85378.1 hypothetical protein PtA15_6A6 [Puccinia triticina]
MTERTSLNRGTSSSAYPKEHPSQFGVELRILSQAGLSSPNPDPSLAKEELFKYSVELIINSYLDQSDDRAVKLVLDLIEEPHEPASLRNLNPARREDELAAPFDTLGQDALEFCIPPPYRSPSITASETLLAGDRADGSTGLHRPSIRSQRTRLRSLKPWHSFTSLAKLDPTYDLKLLSATSSPDSQRRGFWLIPVWKSSVTRSDYYGRFGDVISLPTWADPKLLRSVKPTSSTPGTTQDGRTPTPIVWNPIRLSLFWKVICIICEKRKLGDVSATAMATSQTKDMLPYTKPIPTNSKSISPEPEDVFGDHIRIWSNLQTSLIVRRVISDITIRSSIQANGTNQESSVPFLSLSLSREELEEQAGEYEQKWMKECVFMWLDDTGTPRGYG